MLWDTFGQNFPSVLLRTQSGDATGVRKEPRQIPLGVPFEVESPSSVPALRELLEGWAWTFSDLFHSVDAGWEDAWRNPLWRCCPWWSLPSLVMGPTACPVGSWPSPGPRAGGERPQRASSRQPPARCPSPQSFGATWFHRALRTYRQSECVTSPGRAKSV